ncbi:MAG: 50S ribosomal protein L4 [Actinobacteria bacterium]|nr:50S ribosomal protein L4 [Actinomycetota bacterium]MBL7123779.1 50S ribosomal protein L4 [Actinomycetota bacterium]
MASLDVLDLKGKEIEKINISNEIVKQESNNEILYQEVRRYLASIRSGTSSTKGRSEVRGGGRKPWRQKGTGNARAGSIRSPIWKGGGVVFGPKPRNYSFKLNKKVIKKSKFIAMSEKFKEKKIIVLDKLAFKKPKTKKAYEILEKFKLIDKKVLVILENTSGDEAKSFRNIENVLVTSARSLNTYNILISDYLVFTKNSLTELVGGLANEGS